VTLDRHTPRVITDADDAAPRVAIFDYLRQVAETGGGIIRFQDLDRFTFKGQRLPLVQRPRGIRAVPGLSAAITILTTYRADPRDRPYDDAEGPDGYLRYKWLGSNPNTRDNAALRTAWLDEKPLVWFFGIGSGEYRATFPVYVVDEEPETTQFVVALDDALRQQWEIDPTHPADLVLRRLYALRVARQRVHQPVFRGRVLAAYQFKCSLCRLRHPELLEAAHIKSDAEGGEPVVPNGVSMCAIHHRAFDHDILGIRSDYVVEIRPDVLQEQDGPTLKHALQGLHHERLAVPRQPRARPDPILLEERLERFKNAS
jgi:putative restriction endonuclease